MKIYEIKQSECKKNLFLERDSRRDCLWISDGEREGFAIELDKVPQLIAFLQEITTK